MTNITITIPDAQAQRVINAVCDQYGYKAKLEDGTDNPQTKGQFAKSIILRFVKEVVMAREASVAAEQARQSAMQTAESELTLS